MARAKSKGNTIGLRYTDCHGLSMKFAHLCVGVGILGALFPGPLAASRDRAPAHARVTLIADLATVPAAGQPWLGVRFAIDDGWHIYWRNPGESGTPPQIHWQPTPALAIGPTNWPVPERIAAAGDTTYGYQHDVTLLAAASRGDGAGARDPVTVSANIDYVICHDVCVYEHASPSLTLRAGAATRSADAPAIALTRAHLPEPWPARWTSHAVFTKTDAQLRVTTTLPDAPLSPPPVFFPLNPGEIDDGAAPRVEGTTSSLTMHFKPSAFLSRIPAALEGILGVGGKWYSIRAPLTKNSPSPDQERLR